MQLMTTPALSQRKTETKRKLDQPRHGWVWFVGTMTIALLSACKPEVSPPSMVAVAGSVDNHAMVQLAVSAADTTFQSEPACTLGFQATNRGALPLAVFSGLVVPVRADGGQPLKTVSLSSIGIAGLSPEQPLMPGAQGKVWPLNIKGVACNQVRVRFDKFHCSFVGQPCSAVKVEQQGLAGIEPPALPKRASGK